MKASGEHQVPPNPSSLTTFPARRPWQLCADGSSDRPDVDRHGGVHRDKLPDTNRPIIFSTHVNGNAGQHMNGMTCPGAVVVAARGKPRVAECPFTGSIAITVDWLAAKRVGRHAAGSASMSTWSYKSA
jgi:hypothetical protein